MKNFLFLFIFVISTSVYGLEGDDVDLIEKFDLISSSIPIDDEDWTVNPSELDQDPFKFKNQERNVIDWNNLDEKAWLNIDIWIKDRDFKDTYPNWRRRFREINNPEIMGRVIKCVGVCFKYHETVRHNAEFRVMLKEGDEAFTDEDSYMWIMVSDGSLIKLMPKTSITLQEYNIGSDQNMVLIRLNQGQIHYQPRLKGQFDILDEPESDLSMYPLKILDANREYYAIQEYRKMNDKERLLYSIEKNPGFTSQYKRLNQLQSENDEFIDRKTEFFFYTPNMTMYGMDSAVDIFYEPNGKTLFRATDELAHFKARDKNSKATIGYRGYTNKELFKPIFNTWYEIKKDGSSIKRLSSFKKEYAAIESSLSFTKRIPTIQLAREILFKEHIRPLFQTDMDAKRLALDYGYRLWNVENKDELHLRKEYIIEYIRRTETTNLQTIAHLFRKVPLQGYTKRYLARAMKDHYLKLKKRFKEANLVVREMNDTEYYIWILKNGNT